MKKNKVVKILEKVGAVIVDDHFVYTSGMHGGVYINKDALYPHTKETSKVCLIMAESFKKHRIDVVVGPALGGIILSQWVAYHLSKLKKKEVLGIYTEKDSNNNQVFTRGYDELVKDKQVLIVEDLTTTGSSVKKVIRSVTKAGGKVVGVCVMVNRNPKKINTRTMGVFYKAVGVIEAKAFDEKDCLMCEKDVPINTEIGHGKKYLERLKKGRGK